MEYPGAHRPDDLPVVERFAAKIHGPLAELAQLGGRGADDCLPKGAFRIESRPADGVGDRAVHGEVDRPAGLALALAEPSLALPT